QPAYFGPRREHVRHGAHAGTPCATRIQALAPHARSAARHPRPVPVRTRSAPGAPWHARPPRCFGRTGERLRLSVWPRQPAYGPGPAGRARRPGARPGLGRTTTGARWVHLRPACATAWDPESSVGGFVRLVLRRSGPTVRSGGAICTRRRAGARV